MPHTWDKRIYKCLCVPNMSPGSFWPVCKVLIFLRKKIARCWALQPESNTRTGTSWLFSLSEEQLHRHLCISFNASNMFPQTFWRACKVLMTFWFRMSLCWYHEHVCRCGFRAFDHVGLQNRTMFVTSVCVDANSANCNLRLFFTLWTPATHASSSRLYAGAYTS